MFLTKFQRRRRTLIKAETFGEQLCEAEPKFYNSIQITNDRLNAFQEE
jgi:hypothetical protein